MFLSVPEQQTAPSQKATKLQTTFFILLQQTRGGSWILEKGGAQIFLQIHGNM